MLTSVIRWAYTRLGLYSGIKIWWWILCRFPAKKIEQAQDKTLQMIIMIDHLDSWKCAEENIVSEELANFNRKPWQKHVISKTQAIVAHAFRGPCICPRAYKRVSVYTGRKNSFEVTDGLIHGWDYRRVGLLTEFYSVTRVFKLSHHCRL